MGLKSNQTAIGDKLSSPKQLGETLDVQKQKTLGANNAVAQVSPAASAARSQEPVTKDK
jgi:hypothetical protein